MPKKAGQNSAVFTVDELAIELGISRQSAYNGLNSGEIPAIRLGKRFIISKVRIAEWLKTGRTSAA